MTIKISIQTALQIHLPLPTRTLWETVRFQLLLPVHGTLCHLSSEINSHWWPIDINWKQYCSGHPLARMLIPELRHCQHVTVLVFVRWPCNVCAWQCHL